MKGVTHTCTAGVHLLVAALIFGTLGAIGCGGFDKGEGLLELEALRESNYTRAIRADLEEVNDPRVLEFRERAADAIGQSDEWYTASIEAAQAREDEASEEMATQGVLLYRAAEAFSRAADNRARIELANANYQLQLERRNRYNGLTDANGEVIELLTALQVLYDDTEDCRVDLRGFSAEQQSHVRANFALGQARFHQREAEMYGADTFAASAFGDGTRMLAEAQTFFEAARFDSSFDVAMSASERFAAASADSRSDFANVREALLRGRNEDTYDEAAGIFGDAAYVDRRGLVIIVPDLFPDRRSEIRDDKTYQLEQIAALIRGNRGVEIHIEGHGSDSGSRDANTSLSMARAEGVRDWLVSQDVRSSRLHAEAMGEDYPRYDNRSADGRAANNRIEVIFDFQ